MENLTKISLESLVFEKLKNIKDSKFLTEQEIEEPVNLEEILPVPDYEDIKEKLNLLRSGKSLAIPKVGVQLNIYISNLSDLEKRAFYAFLDAATKILSAEEPASQVSTPSRSPYMVLVSDSRDQMEEELEIKRAKKAEQKGTFQHPIIVGETANKDEIINVVRENSD